MSHYATLPRALALAAPIALGAWTVQAADIVETAAESGRFNGFLHLIEAAGMAETLQAEGPFTVFAPIDEAFDQLPPGMLDRLLAEENRRPLEAVIQAHIVADAAIPTQQLLGRAVEVATIGGGTLAIDGTTGIIALAPIGPSVTEVEGRAGTERTSVATPISVTVVEAPEGRGADAPRPATPATQELLGVAIVVAPDIGADNGLIHGIDLLLLPPEVLWSF